MLRLSVVVYVRIEVCILHELTGGCGLQLSMGMRDAIDGRVNVCVSKSHIESDGVVIVRVGARLRNDFRLVCARPGFAP